MASGWYNSGLQLFANGDIDWTTADVRVILIDTADYTVNLTTHDFLDDVAGASRVATSAASIQTKSVAGAGVLDGDNITFSSVTGDPSEALILYVHTGTEGTSTLLLYIDGLSVTPNGGTITVQWSDGAGKIAAL